MTAAEVLALVLVLQGAEIATVIALYWFWS
jgi:hypothetical protein